MQKVVLQTRLKSSILDVKSKGLQQIPVLKQELVEKHAIIDELGRQLAAAQAGGGGADAGSSSSVNQEELAQSQSKYLATCMFE